MHKYWALVLATVLLPACGGGGGGGNGSGNGQANAAPQADAGTDYFASELAPALLDGSASSDSDGTIVTYLWEQLEGPAVTIDNPSQATTSFPAPAVAAPIELGFQLTVTDNDGASNAAQVTVTVVSAVSITLSGTVTFDLVPAVTSNGLSRLSYGATQAAPARDITIEVIDATDGVSVIAGSRTDETGAYDLTVPGFIEVFLRARAEMQRSGTPGWDFRVVDNTNGDALYVISGESFNTGGSDLARDLHAASGWNGVSYAEPRSAAPLAILDTIYDAVQVLLTADPDLQFPPLELHWSKDNRPVFGTDGTPDPDTGEIGTSFFRTGPDGGIFLLGAADEDTEEYDRHVIAHEWGHYLEAGFSRSDSIGGPHTQGDQLDFRVAFGEGWGNAFSAIATSDSVYKDTQGALQSFGFHFDVEGEPPENPGWYSESSVQEIIYDIFDDVADTLGGGSDLVNLGIGPIFDVLANEQRVTVAMTSLFPFIDALVADNPGSEAAIDALLDYHDVEPVADEYGSGEDNSGNPASADVLPVYTELMINGGAANLCSSNEFESTFTGSSNKLGSRRYARFQANVSGTHTFTATTTEAPPGETTDPDVWLHQASLHFVSQDGPTQACTDGDLDACIEEFAIQLNAGEDYVLEIYEWTNTNASDDPDNPPIGRACFDVEITQP
jgi:hypothetical protein